MREVPEKTKPSYRIQAFIQFSWIPAALFIPSGKRGPWLLASARAPIRYQVRLLLPARLASAIIIAVAGESPAIPRPAPRRLGFRFVHAQGATVHLRSIQRRNRFGRFVVIGHLDEAEAAGAACIPVRDQLDARDFSKWLEDGPQSTFRGFKTHVSDKYILHISFLLNL